MKYRSQIGSVGSSWPRSLPVFRLIKCTLAQALHVTASYSVSETSSFLTSSRQYRMSSLVKGHVHTKAGIRLPFFISLMICEGARPPELRKSGNSSAISRVNKECRDQKRRTAFFRSRHSRGGAPSVGAFIGEDWRSLLRTHAKDLLFAARTDEYPVWAGDYVNRRLKNARRMTRANLRRFAH